MICFLDCTLPGHVQLFLRQYPQTLLRRTALNPLILQPIWGKRCLIHPTPPLLCDHSRCHPCKVQPRQYCCSCYSHTSILQSRLILGSLRLFHLLALWKLSSTLWTTPAATIIWLLESGYLSPQKWETRENKTLKLISQSCQTMIFKMESFSENKMEAVIDSSQQWWSVIWIKLCM